MPSRAALLNELRWMLASARAPRLRTMSQFAEEEIVLVDEERGPHRFTRSEQPFAGLYLDAVESGRYNRFAITGCVQSGKSVLGYETPLLHHLFELRESVLCGIPQMEMARDKWREKILPVIERTRYRDLLPRTGLGSRGGSFDAIKFRHGPTLKFMTGGGGDEKRSSYTCRVLVITETDKMDEVGGTSRETDKISQLENRLSRYDEFRRRVYLECTVSIAEGRIWREYQRGTRSRIVVRCPACGLWVTPEREHLVGWQEAETIWHAREAARWSCPECKALWDDETRRALNKSPRLLHKGQEIDPEGQIHGEGERTNTLGFRWNAFNNLFWGTDTIAAKEWEGARNLAHLDEAETELRQFYWALPAIPPEWEEEQVCPEGLFARIIKTPPGVVPAWCDVLTMGVDLRKTQGHWVVVAWKKDGTCHVVDYGIFPVAGTELAIERAIYQALEQFADGRIATGWIMEGTGAMRLPDQVWIDSGYKGKSVCAFCAKRGDRYRPVRGYGTTEQKYRFYRHPAAKTREIRVLGEEYHFKKLPGPGRLLVVNANADFWKSFLRARLTTELESPGAMTFHQRPAQAHSEYFRHLMAEKETTQFVKEKGYVVRWVAVSHANHFLDATYLNSPASHWCGVRIIEATREEPSRSQSPIPNPQSAIPGPGWFAQRKNKAGKSQ